MGRRKAVRDDSIDAVVPKLITVAQLSRRCGVSTRSIYRMVQDDKIPHYRFDRTIRFRDSDYPVSQGKDLPDRSN